MKFLGVIVKSLVALTCVALAFWLWRSFKGSGSILPPPVTPTARTVVQFDRTKIKEIKELELLVLPYGDIKHQSYSNKSGKEVAHADYMYNGLGQLTLDLMQVRWEERLDPKTGVTNLVVVLPEVKVGGAKIFHHAPSEKNEYAWVSGIIGDFKEASNIKVGELERAAREDAQKQIVSYMMRPENVKAARRQAEAILRVMLMDSVQGEIEFSWPELPLQDVTLQ